MSQRLAVCDLARELGVPSVDILWTAKRLNLNIRRVAAELTAAQEKRLRDEHKAGRLRRPKPRQIMQSAPPPPPPKIHTARCHCCDTPHTYRDDGRPHPYCRHCLDHHPIDDEPITRALDRAQAHEDQAVELVAMAWQEVAKARGETNVAYGARDKWRRMLVSMAVAHEKVEGGGCCCGAARFPCVTRRQLVIENLGIAKQVEALECLPDDELKRFLGGDNSIIGHLQF